MPSLNQWLGELYRRHHRDLVRFTARLVGDRDGGEEVVQNTYLRLAGRGPNAAVIEYQRAYVFAAARNAAVDFSVRQNAEWLHRVDFEEIDSLVQGDDLTHVLHHRQRVIRLAVLLNELPSACRTAFLLNKVEGRSHREIANRLGISVSMVEKHIMRSLVHCRDLMRDDGEG